MRISVNRRASLAQKGLNLRLCGISHVFLVIFELFEGFHRVLEPILSVNDVLNVILKMTVTVFVLLLDLHYFDILDTVRDCVYGKNVMI